MDWFFSQEDLHYYSLDFDLTIGTRTINVISRKGLQTLYF